LQKRILNLDELITKALVQTPFKPETVTLKNHTFPFMRLEIPIPGIDPLAWLEQQTLYPKIYFETPKTGFRVAGVGATYTIDEIPSFHRLSASPRFFGGMDFYERKFETWKTFPRCRYVLPLVEIEVRHEMTYLCVNRTCEALDLSEIRFNPAPISTISQKATSRLDSPSFPVWDRNIRESLKQIQEKSLDKIVLARASLFEFEKPLSPLAFCKALQGKSPAATVFSYQFSADQAFVGATPESLYIRTGSKVETAAIAGTRKRGKTDAEDKALQADLLRNAKEMHEFNVVKEEIEKRLSPLCTTLTKQNEDKIIQTSTVQHIYNLFQGELSEGIDDTSLIHALHPTPAVGGRPKEAALKEIRKWETFDRGWYAAPVGWISPEQAHILVAIRSALIHANELRLFAGTGIVPGSVPEKEWDELGHKISQFILWE
jgi:menaquinone-specific isochorismate synthase